MLDIHVDQYNATQKRINQFIRAGLPIPEYELHDSWARIAVHTETMTKYEIQIIGSGQGTAITRLIGGGHTITINECGITGRPETRAAERLTLKAHRGQAVLYCLDNGLTLA
jgi:hypothetical protein